MKKKLLFYAVTLFFGIQELTAQDTILFRNGTEKTNVKIEEIGENVIKYRIGEDGPLTVQHKSDFLLLKLGNGESIVIDEHTSPQEKTPTKTKTNWGLNLGGGLSLYTMTQDFEFTDGSKAKITPACYFTFGPFVEFVLPNIPTYSMGFSIDATHCGGNMKNNYNDELSTRVWLVGPAAYFCFRHKNFYLKSGLRFDILASAHYADSKGGDESIMDYCKTFHPGVMVAIGGYYKNLDISLGGLSYFTKLIEDGEGSIFTAGLHVAIRINRPTK